MSLCPVSLLLALVEVAIGSPYRSEHPHRSSWGAPRPKRSRASVSQITRTGGEDRGARHRPAFQRRFQLPERRVSPAPDGLEGQAGARLAAVAFERAIATIGVELCLGSVASTIRLSRLMAARSSPLNTLAIISPCFRRPTSRSASGRPRSNV